MKHINREFRLCLFFVMNICSYFHANIKHNIHKRSRQHRNRHQTRNRVQTRQQPRIQRKQNQAINNGVGTLEAGAGTLEEVDEGAGDGDVGGVAAADRRGHRGGYRRFPQLRRRAARAIQQVHKSRGLA